MKVLFVESALSGHRKIYHKALIEGIGLENSVLITSTAEDDIHCIQVVDDAVDLRPRKIGDYLSWLKHIKKAADEHNVDIIHFLDGDLLYRFCGIKLNQLCRYKIIVTFHHVRDDWIHMFSIRQICRKITGAVVHTDYLRNRLCNLANIRLIDYPYFPSCPDLLIPERKESRTYFDLDDSGTVLLALGGTRFEKGVDILLNSLKGVAQEDVVLLIAGKEEYFKREDLEAIDTGRVKVVYCLKQLTDEEWNRALSASDIVVLPYRKSFAGASGPLTDAVWFKKPVIGKDDNSIGDLIRGNGLGWTFEAENAEDLTHVINSAAEAEFVLGKKYLRFRDRISVDNFRRKYAELYRQP